MTEQNQRETAYQWLGRNYPGRMNYQPVDFRYRINVQDMHLPVGSAPPPPPPANSNSISNDQPLDLHDQSRHLVHARYENIRDPGSQQDSATIQYHYIEQQFPGLHHAGRGLFFQYAQQQPPLPSSRPPPPAAHNSWRDQYHQ